MLDNTNRELLLNGYQIDSIDVINAIKSFPTTRYYGSKRRLLPWIYENTKNIEFDSVLDAFGGTASTSLLFNAMGKKVTFNDALNCNQVIAKALLEADKNVFSRDEFKDFILSVVPTKGLISKIYDGDYFTADENQWLDGIALKIHSLKCESKKSILLYCLFQACLQKRPFNLFHRKNLYLRTNNVNRTFGNLTTWNTEFSVLMLKIYDEFNKIQLLRHKHSKVIPATDAAEIKGNFDLVYLDPPYITSKPNSDTYLKKYHFLEGLSKYKSWEDNINPKTGRYQHENLNIEATRTKSAFLEYIYKLLSHYKNSIVVMSYMSNAFPSKNDLSDIFQNSFDKTIVCEKELSHALAKTKRNELLFIGQ